MALGACGGDDPEESGPGEVDCSTSQDNYVTFGKSFFDTSCNNCHGSAGTDPLAASARFVATFDTQAQIQEKADAIQERLFHPSVPMPPASAPQPSAADKQRAGAWLECGAP